MEIGIIGLPKSGKTTVFNAVTKGDASTSSYANKSNVGVAKVPDKRLDALAKMYQPRRVVPAGVTYIDVPSPPEGFGSTRGIGGEYLNALQATDALLIVVRGFKNPAVPHVDETIDPLRDANNMLLEMVFSDLDIMTRRLEKLKDGFKGAKAQDREVLSREQDLLARIQVELDNGTSIRNQSLSPDEAKQVSGFGFLSTKPIIIVMNIDEDQMDEITQLELTLAETASGKHAQATVICAQLEMELTQMDEDEEQEYRKGLGAGESSLSRMIQLSYNVVDQISFFTVGEDEVRAWEVRRNTIAQTASGKIHSDLERGFIRAEVIGYDALIECGSLAEARKMGLLRQEGKDYVVQDGEIMHVLFNV